MGKGYWEFLTNDEQESIFSKNCTSQQIQANKSWNEKVKIILY